MRGKWASGSTSGTLNFNAELLKLERELGDYVIVHDLLHFSVPNHGRLRKSLMRAHLGEYERHEEALQRFGGVGTESGALRDGVQQTRRRYTPRNP